MDIYDTSMEVVKELLASGAEVGVIGGWAIWAYNPYKYSMDVDVVLRPASLWKVRERLLQLGFTETSGGHLGKKGFKKAVEGGVIEVDVYDGKIGPFTAIEVLDRSVEKELFGMKTKVASPTDLMILKVYALMERRESGKGQKDIPCMIVEKKTHYEKYTSVFREKIAYGSDYEELGAKYIGSIHREVYGVGSPEWEAIKGLFGM